MISSSHIVLSPLSGLLGDLCPLSPLGNRTEDVREWNKVYGDDESTPKEELSWIERRDRYNEARRQKIDYLWLWIANMVIQYAKGDCPVKHLNEAIDWAMRRAGLNYTSSRTLALLRAYVREQLKERGINYNERRISSQTRREFLLIANYVISHYKKHGNRKLEDVIAWVIKLKGYKFSEAEMAKLLCYVKYLLERRGIDWEILSGVKIQKSLPLTKERNKELRSNTASRGKDKYAPNLVKIAFAILKGRKKLFGFGRYWPQNDEDWITLWSLFWDNCKVVFNERILFRPVYELLELGAKAKDIVNEFGILLHKHHGLAVDAEIEHWQPTGLAKELKENVCRKYLGL